MKLLKSLLVSTCFLIPLAAKSAVSINLHQDIEALVINGKELGFSFLRKKELELEDGQNQIVIRVSKLITRNGEKEKYKSRPVVVTFNLKDDKLVVTPKKTFYRAVDIGDFDEEPLYLFENKKGIFIDLKQQILPLKLGIHQDYSKALREYNHSNGLETETSGSMNIVPRESLSNKLENPVLIIQQLFIKATPIEKEQFTYWAFSNRKRITTSINSDRRILLMLEYWFVKSSVDERSEILTWVIAL